MQNADSFCACTAQYMGTRNCLSTKTAWQEEKISSLSDNLEKMEGVGGGGLEWTSPRECLICREQANQV